MFLKSPLSISPASGFVAFDGGGAVDVDAYRSPVKAPFVIAQPAPAIDARTVEGMPQSATWQPASSARSRLVEGAVIIAICAYFVFGFAGLAHWL